MAFAPNRNSSKKLIPEKQQMFQTINSYQTQNSSDNVFYQRLDMIEANLNRVCNQHDALMPLLKMVEQIPVIQKNEQQIKIINKKFIDQENKIQKVTEREINQQQQQLLQDQAKQVSQITQQIKQDLNLQQNQINFINKNLDTKHKDIILEVQKKIELKFEHQKRDINHLLADFKNSIQQENKRQVYSASPFKSCDNVSPMKSAKKNNKQIQDLQEQIQQVGLQNNQNIDNIYRELGMLRIEVEGMNDKERKNAIIGKIQDTTNQSIEGQKLVIAKIEQETVIEELEQFDQSNQERLNYEMLCLQEKLRLSNISQNELKYVEDRIFSLTNQLQGTKKKYLLELSKLEDKIEKLNKFSDNRQLEQQLEKLNVKMNQNINMLTDQLKKTENQLMKKK